MARQELSSFVKSHPSLLRVARMVGDRRKPQQPRPAPPPRPPFVAPYGRLLPHRAHRLVVVVAGRHAQEAITDLWGCLTDDRLVVIRGEETPHSTAPDGAETLTAGSLDQVNGYLKALGPVDILADFSDGNPANREEQFRRLFFHLRPGGVYLLDRRVAPDLTDGSGILDSLGSRATLMGLPWAETGSSRLERELVNATASVTIDRRYVVVGKRLTHHAKLRYYEADCYLSSRSPTVELRRLATLEGGTLASKSHEVHHEALRAKRFGASMPYPEAALRHYEGPVTMSSHGLLTADCTILPDSFRFFARPSLDPHDPRSLDLNRDFARLRRVEPRDLPGSFYHVDPAYPGHFGHLMGEVVSRLWGWDQAKAEIPDLKAIFHTSQRDPSGSLERQLLGWYGIAEDDIVGVDGPVRLDSVVSAAPLWHNSPPFHIHPRISDVWARLGVGRARSGTPTPDRIFISRQTERRRLCRNRAEVEAFFEKKGFTVVFPETLDLNDQAAIFANASAIAGFAGSALFNLVFAKRLRTLVVLSHDAYTAQNEHLMASLLGCETHYFWSTPESAHRASPWEFDFPRHEGALRGLLESLPSASAGGPV